MCFFFFLDTGNRTTKLFNYSCMFSAMGVGSADMLTTMMEEEKAHADKYLKDLTERMKSKNVSEASLNYHSCQCSMLHHPAVVPDVILTVYC